MTNDLIHVISKSSDTGKTTIIEKIVEKLTKNNVKVGTIKDIHIEGFSIDEEGKDTWRHAKAGAQVVCARGLDETDFIFKIKMDLEEIIPFLDVDLIIAEGFKERKGRKIIVAKNLDDYKELKEALTSEDEVIAVAGPILEGEGIDDDILTLEDDESLDKLMEKLQPLIQRNKLKRNRLQMPLKSLECKVLLDGKELVMKEYVSQTLKNVIIGAVSELTWNIHDPVSRIGIIITKSKEKKVAPSNLRVKINEKILKLKPFVQDSLIRVVIGYISSLNLPKENDLEAISEIEVVIE
ncbi:MAG: molybdopterin-guanine dinucleotide biosynthesis protein B [Candidatus Hodarchaeota archaeon]